MLIFLFYFLNFSHLNNYLGKFIPSYHLNFGNQMVFIRHIKFGFIFLIYQLDL